VADKADYSIEAKADSLLNLRDLLLFYQTAGVEDALAEAPYDAFSPPAARAAAAPKAAPAAIAAQAPGQQAAPGRETAPAAAAPDSPPPVAQQRQAAANAPRSVFAAPQSGGPRAAPAISRESFDKRLAQAREQAEAAPNLADLKQRIAAYSGCSLKLTARNCCIADGSAPQPLMLIGEGPGAEEDKQALPFVGPAGQLLTLMLAAIGFGRESAARRGAPAGNAAGGAETAAAAPKPQAYITNAVFWRPPGNRNPTDEEIALCRPFLERQIELVQPKIIISLGGVAAGALLRGKHSILRLRGQWRSYATANGAEIPLMPSLHPAYLLRAPAQKKAAWADFLAVKMRLKAAGLPGADPA